MSNLATSFTGHKRVGRCKTALKQSKLIRSDNIHRINAIDHRFTRLPAVYANTPTHTETAAIANRFLTDKSVEDIDPDGSH